MSQENVEVVRRYYAALNAGDLDGVVALCTPNVQFVNPPDAAEPGTRVGPAGLRQAADGVLTAFEDYRCSVQQVKEVGDQVLVIEESSGRGTMSDVPFAAVYAHLFTVVDGRITRFEWFRTPREGFEAVGLPEA